MLFADRVKETTTTTGTGTIDLAGTSSGYRTFVAGIGTGNTCYYCISHQTANEWEVGYGTVTDATPDTLSRSVILSSTNAGSAVSFSSGTKTVICVLPAAAIMDATKNLSDLLSASTARTNLGLGTAATASSGSFCQTSNNLSDVTAATARTNLAVGSTFIGQTTLTATASINIPSVFSATYRYYDIYIDCTGAAALNLQFQLSASGTAVATGYYNAGKKIDHSNTETGLGAVNTTLINIGVTNTSGAFYRLSVDLPYIASFKHVVSQAMGADGGGTNYKHDISSLIATTSLCDGFKLTTSTSTVTGYATVYGRN